MRKIIEGTSTGLLFLLSCFFWSSFAGSSEDLSVGSTPEIRTLNGVLRGKIILTPVAEKVYAFYSIPYAKPPIDELRFKRPIPITSWNGVLDATKLPNSCSQTVFDSFNNFRGEAMWNPNTDISEDCLYLNIWVPESVFQNKDRRLASVILWIHGGGFCTGTSTLDIYNGKVLAGEEKVVVVSINYRLGPLGFLYFGTEDAPGSVGMLDQNLAIQWIFNNIQSFGGDPKSITLFGESAGGASTLFHLLSPLSSPYFKNAILMSPAPSLFKTTEEAYDISVKLATKVGCWSSGKAIEEVISCLRSIRHLELAEVQSNLVPEVIMEYPFVPTVDGTFFTATPNELLTNPSTKKAEILIGNVKDEGSYFLVYSHPNLFKHIKPTSIPYERFVNIINEIFNDRSIVEKQAIVQFYTNWQNPNDGFLNQKLISDIIGDAYYTCVAREIAETWSSRGLNVYYYYFTERTSTNPWGEWLGVLHGDEIEYTFGYPLTDTRAFDRTEQKFSTKVMNLWANFAKHGVPSQQWKPYSKDLPRFLNLNATILSEQTPLNLFGPRADACALWNSYLPKLKNSLDKYKDGIYDENGSCRFATSKSSSIFA